MSLPDQAPIQVTETDSTVLIVDDAPEMLRAVARLLKDLCRVKVAPCGAKALEIALSEDPPDLILLDVMMPDMDGRAVCARLKADPKTADIPVIFLTGRADEDDQSAGLELGAVDFLSKPVSPRILRARVKTHLALKSARDQLEGRAAYLEREVAQRTHEAAVIQDVTMVALASLAETRDNETGNHIRRTQGYIELLVKLLKDHPRFKNDLADEAANQLLVKSAPLHDIGKVGIPDKILLKPGKLTPEEFDVIKTHTTIGRDALLSAERLLDTPSSFLRLGREIAYEHHEKWDGSGYPQGLRENEISFAGRLMALADVYDALISRRIYKPPFPQEKAVAIIREGRGRHFDPDVTDAFLQASAEFEQVAKKYADSEEAVSKRAADA